MLPTWLTLLFSLGTLHVAAAVHTYTSGTSGDPCGDHTCLDSVASCQNGRCKCQSPLTKGPGNFLCVKPTDYFCAILNDPKIIGFDGSETKVPLISSFYVAELITGTCANSEPTGGECDVCLSAWVGRVRGKTFIKGYYAQVSVTYDGEEYFQTFNLSTSAINGNYTYWELESPVPLIIPDHAPVTTTYDAVNNFARLNIEPCGVEIGLRGVEQQGNPFLLPPGVYYKAATDCHGEPYFPTAGSDLCPYPAATGEGKEDQAKIASEFAGRNVSYELAALYKSLYHGFSSDFPGAPRNLESLHETIYGDCDVPSAYDAIEQCYFIIDNPRFWKCCDDTENGDIVVQLMDECCSAICHRNQTECQNVKDRIEDLGCTGGIRSTQGTILESTCEF